MKIFYLGIASIILLSSCGKSKSVDQGNYPVQIYPSGDASGGKILFDAAKVTCESTDDCPLAVGLLTFWVSGDNASSAGMCTTFLISKNLALTNSHCIPNEMRNKAQKPIEQMKIVFPETTGHPSESVGVAEILSFTDLTGAVGKNPDYALLKLSRDLTERAPLQFSQDGMPDDYSLKVYSVTPQSEHEVVGQLESKNCTTMMNSGVQPSYQNIYNSVISFTDCLIRHGNSGSPMVDPNGKVRGIIQAGVDEDSLQSIGTKLGITSLKPLNLGTNAACMNIDNLLKAVDPKCNDKTPQLDLTGGIKQLNDDSGTNDSFQKSIQENVRQFIANWAARSDKTPVQWTSTALQSQSDTFAFPIPKCFFKTAKRISYSLNVPRWKVVTELDSELRLAANVNSDADSSQASVTFGFSSLQYNFSGTPPQSLPGIGYCNL